MYTHRNNRTRGDRKTDGYNNHRLSWLYTRFSEFVCDFVGKEYRQTKRKSDILTVNELLKHISKIQDELSIGKHKEKYREIERDDDDLY